MSRTEGFNGFKAFNRFIGFRFIGFRFIGFRFNGFRFNGFRFNGFRFNGCRFPGFNRLCSERRESRVRTQTL
jgi:hypothetical protein